MDFIPTNIQEYAEFHTSGEDELLAQLNRDTYANVLVPRMLSGHLQGRVLSMISKMVKPRNILEIGTYTGYSALCLAEGLDKKGKLHSIEINEELESRIVKYFELSAFAENLVLHIGNALEVIPTLEVPFDLVFIDADKSNYSTYYLLLIETLPPGAFIVADNVLWSGKVLSEANDADTLALQEFNDLVQNDDRVENVLMPVRDGLMVIRKK